LPRGSVEPILKLSSSVILGHVDGLFPIVGYDVALKQSIEKAKPKQKAAPAQRKRKTASSDL